MGLLDFWKEKKDFDLDAPENTLQHKEIVLRKGFLRKIYEEWYSLFISRIPLLPKGELVEIGAGGGFIKTLEPQVITSDILELKGIDQTFSAEKMPFEDRSLAAICMFNVLHHIPDCHLFFEEASRTLTLGGEIFMIEPANTFFSRWIYKNLHHEPFDTKAKSWEFPSKGPLSDANGALPWLIFKRDLNKFHSQYPQLELKKYTSYMPLRYLLSGGLTFKSFVPSWSFGIVTFLEKITKPFFPITGMFTIIIVTKK